MGIDVRLQLLIDIGDDRMRHCDFMKLPKTNLRRVVDCHHSSATMNEVYVISLFMNLSQSGHVEHNHPNKVCMKGPLIFSVTPNALKCKNSMRGLVIVFGVGVNNTRNMQSEFGPGVDKLMFSNAFITRVWQGPPPPVVWMWVRQRPLSMWPNKRR